jgi:hypothetical protein
VSVVGAVLRLFPVADHVGLTAQEAAHLGQALKGRAHLRHVGKALSGHGTTVGIVGARVGTIAAFDARDAVSLALKRSGLDFGEAVTGNLAGHSRVFLVIVVTTDDEEKCCHEQSCAQSGRVDFREHGAIVTDLNLSV